MQIAKQREMAMFLCFNTRHRDNYLQSQTKLYVLKKSVPSYLGEHAHNLKFHHSPENPAPITILLYSGCLSNTNK